MLLGHLGETAAESRVWAAVAHVLKEGRWLTPGDVVIRAESMR